MSPTFFSAEALVFASAAIRMVQAGELEQASVLFARAAEFAWKAV